MQHSCNPIKEVMSDLKALGYPACAERIGFLHKYDDFEEGEKPLSQESARGFLSFFTKFGYLGEPVLGLFSEGTLSVSWHLADDKHLLIEPLDSDRASFALIGPSSTPPAALRLNGRGAIADVIETLRKNGVHQWKKR